MSTNVIEVIDAARHLTPAERREVLARLWPSAAEPTGREVWMSVRFSEAARVIVYAPEQEAYVEALDDLLRRGALARLENEADGTFEVYGPDRTYYVTMTPAREFAALLSSWPPDQRPSEVSVEGVSESTAPRQTADDSTRQLGFDFEPDEKFFQDLAAQWRKDTRHVSSVSKMAMHPAYQRIIGMGRAVVPFILKELQQRGGHWLWALHAITGEDPAPPEADFRDAARAWLQWGEEKGYLT
jgi:hypothetical protein